MYEFQMDWTGALSTQRFETETKEELLQQVARHLQSDMGVKTPTQTIMNYISTLVREIKAPARR